jgi:hypothetical protein
MVMFPEAGMIRLTSTAKPIGGAMHRSRWRDHASQGGDHLGGLGDRGRQVQRQAVGGARAEPVGRESHADALMRPVGVVVAAKSVDRGLGVSHRPERRMLVQQFPPQAQMEPFDLPGGRRDRGLVSR